MLTILTKGKKDISKIYVQPKTLVSKKSSPVKKPKSNKAEIQKLKNLVNKVKAVKKDPNKIKVELPTSIINLGNLLLFINTHLQDVISANMGEGSRKDVLNYRTGRFAQSAKVESLSQSREGMISAFYTYMKNPYATFSQGGRQQNPRSRDPKLLIGASIREIAAQQVGNRLRAILI